MANFKGFYKTLKHSSLILFPTLDSLLDLSSYITLLGNFQQPFY
ncbi:hypothetical protein HMPREF1557_00837 [Streptococcus sobrinus W1703]|uniref:Uncharacterized protein n=1 Tax=Streptococcus sobrinus W1703 TaxID=1227275 RepID=U2KHM9_9STRE|nr:hypothetical protein HMPREF1557_00837 [Streptococcus sobrinus W1703]